jgi:uncharacterized Tic20 family protein
MEQPDRNIQDERMWGMFCHLSALAAFIIPLGSIIGPLIIWSIKKQEYPFVDDQGKEALNFNISMVIYLIISGILFLLIIGIFMLAAVLIFRLVMTIIAAIRANNGEAFRYPLTIRFIN